MKPKLLYLFKTGRKLIYKNDKYSNDFMYGYDFFKNRGYHINFFDILDLKIKYKLIEWIKIKILSRYFKLNSNFPELISISKIINKYDILICTTNSIAFAASHLKYKKIIFPKIIFINQGILSRIYFLKLNTLKYILLKKYLTQNFNNIDLIIHLGKPEYKYFNKIFSNLNFKSKYLSFGINNKFWNYKNYKLSERKYFLFIGNDLNRDFTLLDRLVNNNPNIDFLFITNKKFKSYKNLKLINGHLTKNLLTDKTILRLYHDAIATLIPLNNTLQPSGQSVFLQSLSSGTPVIITKYDGFFDDYFENFKNCIITNNNNFNQSLNDFSDLKPLLLNNLSKNGRLAIEKKFNMEIIYSEFEKFLLSL